MTKSGGAIQRETMDAEEVTGAFSAGREIRMTAMMADVCQAGYPERSRKGNT
jgi:hypothetical protein